MLFPCILSFLPYESVTYFWLPPYDLTHSCEILIRIQPVSNHKHIPDTCLSFSPSLPPFRPSPFVILLLLCLTLSLCLTFRPPVLSISSLSLAVSPSSPLPSFSFGVRRDGRKRPWRAHQMSCGQRMGGRRVEGGRTGRTSGTVPFECVLSISRDGFTLGAQRDISGENLGGGVVENHLWLLPAYNVLRLQL